MTQRERFVLTMIEQHAIEVQRCAKARLRDRAREEVKLLREYLAEWDQIAAAKIAGGQKRCG